MAAAEIRETIVTPVTDGAIVQLQISDAPLDAEDAAIRIALAVRVAAFEAPLFAHLQRAALEAALLELRRLSQALLREIQTHPHNEDDPFRLGEQR